MSLILQSFTDFPNLKARLRYFYPVLGWQKKYLIFFTLNFLVGPSSCQLVLRLLVGDD